MLKRNKRFLLLEAGVALGLARLAIRTIPFRWSIRVCGDPMKESPDVVDAPAREQAELVAWAVNTARLFTPWDSNCLAQAMAAAWMLQRRAVATTTYLGVMAIGEDELAAHAWLRCGPNILVGDGQLDAFSVVSSFATSGRQFA